MPSTVFSTLVPASGPFTINVGFKPKAALFWTVWEPDGTTTADWATWSYGIWCDTPSQAFGASGSDDNGIPGDGNIAGHNSGAGGVGSFVTSYGAGVPEDEVISVATATGSGFTMGYNPDVAGLRVYGIAFGGKTFDAVIATYQIPNDGSSVTVSGQPWRPMGLIDIQAPDQPTDVDGSAIFGLGMADDHGSQWLSGANATWLNQRNYALSSDEAFSAGWTDGAYSYAAGDGGIYAVTIGDDGFTLDAINGGSSANTITHYTLLLHDTDPAADFNVGTVTDTTGVNSISVGYRPQAIAGYRSCTANAYETAPAWYQFGAADATANLWAWWANWWPDFTTDVHGNKQSGSIDGDTNLIYATSGFLGELIFQADLAGGGITADGFDATLATGLAGFKFGWMTCAFSPSRRGALPLLGVG